MKPGFTIKSAKVANGGFLFRSFKLVRWLNGERIRKQFKKRAEAEGEKQRLEILAGNSDRAVQSVVTRLSFEQVSEAEAAFRRLAGQSQSAAVEWYLTMYRTPLVEKLLAEAVKRVVGSGERAPVNWKRNPCDNNQTTRQRNVPCTIEPFIIGWVSE